MSSSFSTVAAGPRAGDAAGLRSAWLIDGNRHVFHAPLAKSKTGRAPLSAVKLLKSDPAEVDAQSEEIKARYAKLFGV